MKKLLLLSSLLCAAAPVALAQDTIYLNRAGLTLDSAVGVVRDPKVKFYDKVALLKRVELRSDTLSSSLWLPLLPEAKRQKDKAGLMMLYAEMCCQQAVYRRDAEAARRYLDSAAACEHEVSDARTLAKFHTYSASLLSSEGALAQAMQHRHKAIYYLEQLPDRQNTIVGELSNISRYYHSMNDAESMKKVIDKMRALGLQRKDSLPIVDIFTAFQTGAYFELLLQQTKEQAYADSVALYNEEVVRLYPAAKAEKVAAHMEHFAAIAHTNIVYAQLQKPGKRDLRPLWRHVEQAEQLADEQDVVMLIKVLFGKSKLLCAEGRYDAALAAALKGMRHVEPMKGHSGSYAEFMREAYERLTEIYKAQGSYRKALEYAELHAQLQDEVKDAQRFAMLRELETKYDFAKKEQEVQQLAERSATLERQQGLLALAVGLLLATLALGALQWRSYRRQVQLRQLRDKLMIDQLQYNVLRSKFYPHFTGNVLNSINAVIASDPAQAQRYIAEFASFASSTLVNLGRKSWTLKEELSYTGSYLSLEQLRFGSLLQYALSLAPGVDPQREFPVMVAQTFCENAIKHGLRPKPGGGKVEVRVEQRGAELVMSVEDNGIGRRRAVELRTGGHGEGLKIAQQQLELFSRERHVHAALRIIDLHGEAGEATGTRVEVVIS
jgi:hypothetical protein